MYLYCKEQNREYLIPIKNIVNFEFKKVQEYEKHEDSLIIYLIDKRHITICGEKAKNLFGYLCDELKDTPI